MFRLGVQSILWSFDGKKIEKEEDFLLVQPWKSKIQRLNGGSM
jgi:hypothetical protein